MPGADHAEEMGLLDVAGLSLDDLSGLDDSVVANAIRLLDEMRRCGTDYLDTFSNWNSGPLREVVRGM
jgi:hypothetical protein